MNSPTLLDTHILLWSLLQPEELADNIKQHITDAQNNGKYLYQVPKLTVQEQFFGPSICISSHAFIIP